MLATSLVAVLCFAATESKEERQIRDALIDIKIAEESLRKLLPEERRLIQRRDKCRESYDAALDYNRRIKDPKERAENAKWGVNMKADALTKASDELAVVTAQINKHRKSVSDARTAIARAERRQKELLAHAERQAARAEREATTNVPQGEEATTQQDATPLITVLFHDGTELQAQRDMLINGEYLFQDVAGKWRKFPKDNVKEIVRGDDAKPVEIQTDAEATK